ncbi:hypothetical protein KY290_033115 [Solanum tuberosum]|uniref:Uncharacterized protein n=1 Tax=Solanum tuberosum TaxID=4113 RepID=A0ABQ7U188_SOLTU|nr:hypothetical protein KY285_032367 [Solanum tuberosum]KAH0740072.1 hypothetical protein KY290_033115 [Solanum tuberosum]
MLLLSLGTGTTSDFDETYTAAEAARWGSTYMTDYYLSSAFKALGSQDNYLRVQVSPIIMYLVS